LLLAAGLCEAGQKKPTNVFVGAIKKVDANAGTLTIRIRLKKVDAEKEFRITNDSKIMVGTGDAKKELTGQEGLRNDQLKEGTVVTVTTDQVDSSKVKEVRLGGTTKKKKNG
jgi:hypothetical protein